MEKIHHNDILIGFKITKMEAGSNPLTAAKEPLQVIALKHPKEAYLKAHMHEPTVRTTERLQECVVVLMGKIKIDLYSPDKVLFESIFLEAGEAFLLQQGGFGIHIIEDAEILELKNGPFVEDKILI